MRPNTLAEAVERIQAGSAQDVELAEFFPNSASDADKQRFVLKRLFSGGTSIDAPSYPRTDR